MNRSRRSNPIWSRNGSIRRDSIWSWCVDLLMVLTNQKVDDEPHDASTEEQEEQNDQPVARMAVLGRCYRSGFTSLGVHQRNDLIDNSDQAAAPITTLPRGHTELLTDVSCLQIGDAAF